jgi:hypothetical protein
VPELYAGLQRDETSFPVLYKGANAPQAWAAGSCFSILQAMLGFHPDAPHGKLYIDPCLPHWMPDLELTDLRLGEAVLDLRLWRDGDATRWEVTRGPVGMVEQRDFARKTNLWPPEAQASEKPAAKAG